MPGRPQGSVSSASRRSVDLSAYPELVMIMLGFRLRGWRGLLALRTIGPGVRSIAKSRPDGLLAHEDMRFGLMHFGFRQYWRDMGSLERFTRSEPHAGWWSHVHEIAAGAGFWHESYHSRGGIEAIYVAMPEPVGLRRFAPDLDPVGSLLSARARVAGHRTPGRSPDA